MTSLAIKNTFIHLDAAEDHEGSWPQRKRASVPLSARLAGPDRRLSALRPALDSHWEASTDSTDSGGEESGPPSGTASVASDTPPASPRRPRWADVTEEARLLPPPPPPPPPPAGVGPGAERRRRLNAKAAAYQPRSAGLPAVDPEARALTAQVAGLMEQLQVTFNCGSRPVKVEVLGGERAQCCVVLRIRPEDSWLAESLLTAAKEALLRISANDSGVYVLGFNGRPFTPQPSGFSGILAKVRDSSQACWEMYKQGACSRGASCRWQHPAVGFPVNVFVSPTAGMGAPAA